MASTAIAIALVVCETEALLAGSTVANAHLLYSQANPYRLSTWAGRINHDGSMV